MRLGVALFCQVGPWLKSVDTKASLISLFWNVINSERDETQWVLVAGGCVELIRGFFSKRRVQRAHNGVQTELVRRRTPLGRRLFKSVFGAPRVSQRDSKVSHPFSNNDDRDGKTPEKIPLLISLHILESADFKDQMTGCLEMLQSSVLNIFKQIIFLLCTFIWQLQIELLTAFGLFFCLHLKKNHYWR